jgi:hypothetical protein
MLNTCNTADLCFCWLLLPPSFKIELKQTTQQHAAAAQLTVTATAILTEAQLPLSPHIAIFTLSHCSSTALQ